MRDRDRVYGGDVVARARGLGIETLLTPVRAPGAYAIAERIVRALRNECFYISSWSTRRTLRASLGEYATYHNTHRPHRGLQLEPPLRPRRGTPIGTGAILARSVLG